MNEGCGESCESLLRVGGGLESLGPAPPFGVRPLPSGERPEPTRRTGRFSRQQRGRIRRVKTLIVLMVRLDLPPLPRGDDSTIAIRRSSSSCMCERNRDRQYITPSTQEIPACEDLSEARQFRDLLPNGPPLPT